MSTYVSNRDGGKTNEEGHYRFHVKAWSGNVLSGLQAQQKSPLSLGVDITVGDVKVDYSNYGYTAWTDALESVTLTTADPSNPRIDRVVGYIDRGVTPSSGVTNNPGILKFKAVAGTPAGSPSAPNDAAVQSSVGASNPWFNIANVTVGTGVTTISSGNITDTRVIVKTRSGSVNTASLDDNSITVGKTDMSSFLLYSYSNTASVSSTGTEAKNAYPNDITFTLTKTCVVEFLATSHVTVSPTGARHIQRLRVTNTSGAVQTQGTYNAPSGSSFGDQGTVTVHKILTLAAGTYTYVITDQVAATIIYRDLSVKIVG